MDRVLPEVEDGRGQHGIRLALVQNLEKMLHGETGANKGKREAAVKAKEINVDEAHDLFDESSRDEARHAMMLKGLLERFFK